MIGRSGQPVPESLTSLTEQECWLLLRHHTLGRVAVVVDGRPKIFPVNYRAGEGAVVFRTAPGTKLAHGPMTESCFEIDGWDPDGGIGWSVVAKGIAHDVTEPRGAPTGRMRFWPVRPLAPGSREHWIGVWVSEITGRWFRTSAHRPPG